MHKIVDEVLQRLVVAAGSAGVCACACACNGKSNYMTNQMGDYMLTSARVNDGSG